MHEFEDMSPDLGPIEWNASPGILRIGDYVERWRIALWEKAFIPFFKGEVPFTKASKLLEMATGVQAIKRVLFRCVPYFFPTPLLELIFYFYSK